MNQVLRTSFFIIFQMLLLTSWSQRSPFSWSLGAMPGYLMAHSPDLENIESHMIGFDVQVEVDQSPKLWGANYRSPVVGYGLNFYEFGREETGWALGLQWNIRFDILSNEHHALSVRYGAGLGYLSKPFDLETNLRNQAIGSHWNGFMQLCLTYSYILDRGQRISAGAALSHFSNGAYKVPNLGFNMPSLMLRYSHPLIVERNIPRSAGENPWLSEDRRSNWMLSTSLVGTQKQRNLSKPATFNVWGLQVRTQCQKGPKHGWRIGLDAMLDKTYAYVENITVDLDSVPAFSQLELGLAAGKSWSMGRFDILAEFGAYLWAPNNYKRSIYNRVGFQYKLQENWALYTSLKFHRAVADYFEFGLSYKVF